jgi:hypothetical protein
MKILQFLLWTKKWTNKSYYKYLSTNNVYVSIVGWNILFQMKQRQF